MPTACLGKRSGVSLGRPHSSVDYTGGLGSGDMRINSCPFGDTSEIFGFFLEDKSQRSVSFARLTSWLVLGEGRAPESTSKPLSSMCKREPQTDTCLS